MVDEARVTYRAVAHFLELKKAVAGARKDFEALRKEEARVNADSQAGSKKTAQGHRDATKALRSRTTSTKTFTASILAQNKALKENLSLTRSSGTAAQTAAAKIKVAAMVTKDAAKDTAKLVDEQNKTTAASQAAAAAAGNVADANKDLGDTAENAGTKTNAFRRKIAEWITEGRKFIPVSRRVEGGATNVLNTFRKIGNYRPHLIPPFVALVPIIAGLLALLNPLVAVLGAVGAAGFGAGAGILSMGGALIAIVPMIAAAVGGIAGLLVAFKGIGSVFSKYSQGKDAMASSGGAGGAAKTAADEAWRNMKAQERLTDAQEDALDAQEDLTKARADAIKKLNQLNKAVKQNALDEQQAAASLQQATENYYNVMADPGSTLGDKMDATAELAQAQQDLADAQARSKEDQEALNKAQAAGVEGDEDVIAAQRRLRDSLRNVRDAQHDLNTEVGGTGGSGGAVGAMDQYEQALAKLSPSARAVVLALIAMQGAWENVQRTVQEAFFSKIVNDMDDLAGMLPTIENLLAKAAGAMGNFAHNFLMLVSSPAWKSDLAIISDQNVRLIDLAAAAVLSLLDALKDITIAAGPFAENLLKSFSNLSASFRGIVADARATGSLANWLDVVYKRIQQWWRIVKNVAQTLFNYGAASAPFGQWITDGLEDVTEGWKDASEEARKAGSPFQDWLERIKPVLSELKGLIGDFFGWASSTAMDQETLDHTQAILKTIRDELGPALDDIFDALNESGIGEAFVSSLSSIIESIATIVENGGAEGFKNFFTILESFFGAIASLAETGGGKWFVSNFIPAMGVLAGLTFVGKFTGLFTLFGWILKLAKTGGVAKLLASLGGLKGVGALAGIAGAGVAGGAGVAKGINEVRNGPDMGQSLDTLFDPKSTRADKNQVYREQADATAGAVIPPGLRGLLDAIAPDIAKDWEDFLADSQYNMNTSFMDVLDGATATWNTIAPNIGFLWNSMVVIPFQNMIAGIGIAWNTYVVTPFQNLVAGIGIAWNTYVVVPFSNLVAGIGLAWNTYVVVPFSTMVTGFKIGWQTYVVAPFSALITGFRVGWQTYVVTPFNNVIAGIRHLWQTYVVNPFNVLISNIGQAWRIYVSDPFRSFISDIRLAWKVYVSDPFSAAARAIQTGWDGVVNFFKGFNLGKFFGGDTSRNDKRGSGGGATLARVKSVLPKSLGVTSTYRTPAQNRAVGGAPNSYHTDKENPAVDIAGPVGAMDSFAAVLRKMGGWRQLLYRVPGHYDHIHVAHNGGEVSSSWPRSPGDRPDERTTRLQVGEVVVPKSLASPFTGAGLAGSPVGTGALAASSSARAAAQTMIDNSTHIGDIHIHNPAREAASDSLPSALRKVAYAGGRRKPSPRLETTE